MRRMSIFEKIVCGFNFRYAGVVELWIEPKKNGFYIYGSGFKYLLGVFTFSPDNKFKEYHETLYSAIDEYRHIIHDCISSLDWYTPDFFDDKNFMKVYNKNIY